MARDNTIASFSYYESDIKETVTTLGYQPTPVLIERILGSKAFDGWERPMDEFLAVIKKAVVEVQDTPIVPIEARPKEKI